MSSWVMVLCLSLLSLRRLPVLYLLPSARRISSTTNPMIPLIINMPFLSLNPKKLCLDLRLGRPPALPAGQLLDKVTARRSPERTTSHRAARMPSPWRRPEPPQGRMNLTWCSEIGGRRTSNAGNPCNCWTGGTERLVQDKKKKKRLKRNPIRKSKGVADTLHWHRGQQLPPQIDPPDPRLPTSLSNQPRKHQCSSI